MGNPWICCRLICWTSSFDVLFVGCKFDADVSSHTITITSLLMFCGLLKSGFGGGIVVPCGVCVSISVFAFAFLHHSLISFYCCILRINLKLQRHIFELYLV